MKKTEVPQDHVSTYAGQRKLFYAVDDSGEYTGVKSTGWEVEGEATKDAIRQIEEDCHAAWQRARRQESSPLEFHMYRCRMDLPMLAQTVGLFQWRVKRHFKPAVFAKLSASLTERYCDALGLTEAQLKALPEHYPS